MTEPQISSRKPPRRRWPWLFAALLPVALYAVIAEKRSWQPREKYLPTPSARQPFPYLLTGWKDETTLSVLEQLVNQGTSNGYKLIEWDVSTGAFNAIAKYKSPGACGGPIEMFSPQAQSGICSNNGGENTLVDLRRGSRAESIDLGEAKLVHLRGMELVDCKATRKAANTPEYLKIDFTEIPTVKVKRSVRVISPKGRWFSCVWDTGYQFFFSPPILSISATGHIGAVAAMEPKTNFHDQLLIFNARSGRHLHNINFVNESIGFLLCSDDGRKVATLSSTIIGKSIRTMRVWDVHSGTAMLTWTLPSCEGNFIMAFSPDAKWFAIMEGHNGHIWNLQTGQIKRTLKAHHKAQFLSFSPSGSTLAAFDGERTITLYRLK